LYINDLKKMKRLLSLSVRLKHYSAESEGFEPAPKYAVFSILSGLSNIRITEFYTVQIGSNNFKMIPQKYLINLRLYRDASQKIANLIQQKS
jgi:hypothetical protein